MLNMMTSNRKLKKSFPGFFRHGLDEAGPRKSHKSPPLSVSRPGRLSDLVFRQPAKGFTLVELLVVTALIAIMAAIGIPAITSQLAHQRLTRCVREAATELQGARMKAIARNNRYRVVFNLLGGATPDTYRMNVYDSGAGTWSAEPERPLMSMRNGIDITSPGASFNVDFWPNGTATATQICISNTSKSGDRMRVDVQGSTGMVTVRTGC